MAFAVIDNGPEHDLVWVSAIDLTGEICRMTSPQMRMRLKEASGRGTAKAEPRNAATLLRASDAFIRDEGGDQPGEYARAIYIPDADAEHSAFP